MVQSSLHTTPNLEQSSPSCLYPQGDPFINKPFTHPGEAKCNKSTCDIGPPVATYHDEPTTNVPDLTRLKKKTKTDSPFLVERSQYFVKSEIYPRVFSRGGNDIHSKAKRN